MNQNKIENSNLTSGGLSHENPLSECFFFVATNILIIATVSLVMSLLGVQPYLDAKGINYQSLLVFCVLWGFWRRVHLTRTFAQDGEVDDGRTNYRSANQRL